MTSVLQPTLLVHDDGDVWAQCALCSLCLELLPDVPVDDAVAAFRAAHPDDHDAHRRGAVPRGWRPVLSWPGALSQ
ncbi:MAG: hypothetical protein ACLGIG_07140 [Actinomycetes bacterium]